MAGKYAPDRVLNPLPRRIFRRRITRAEQVSTLALIGALLIAGAWIVAQRDNYDPGERDISYDALVAGSIDELPYHAPLTTWSEPGSGGGGAGAAPSLGIFPVALLAGGWQLDGRVETYDPSNLYEKINGQAEQYLSFGFRELNYVTLAREGTYLTLEVYDQQLFRNALGVFASQRDPTQPVSRQGPLRFYRTAVGAIGLVDNLFFKVTASDTGDAVREKTDGLLEMLAVMPRELDSTDAPFTILADGLGLPFGRIAFENENALQYEFFGEVWFGSLESPADARVFLRRLDSAEDAAALYERLVEEQLYEHEEVVRSAERATLRHEFLETFFALAHRGPWIFGVDGAPDAASADSLMARLEKELS